MSTTRFSNPASAASKARYTLLREGLVWARARSGSAAFSFAEWKLESALEAVARLPEHLRTGLTQKELTIVAAEVAGRFQELAAAMHAFARLVLGDEGLEDLPQEPIIAALRASQELPVRLRTGPLAQDELAAVAAELVDCFERMTQAMTAWFEALTQGNGNRAQAVLEADKGNRAQAVLEAFRQNNAALYEEVANRELPDRSEEAAHGWVADGLIVPASELAKAWKRTRQSLEQACQRNELFRIRVGAKYYYPAVFKHLLAADVANVSRELAGSEAVSQLVFWSRNHGALAGRTVAQAIRAGQIGRVVGLAKAYAEENGWQPADADT